MISSGRKVYKRDQHNVSGLLIYYRLFLMFFVSSKLRVTSITESIPEGLINNLKHWL